MSTDFFLNNANLLPRNEVRIERVAASPFPDQRRVKLEVDVTPFRERPNLEIAIRDAQGRAVSVASILSTMHFKMEFVMHLRGVERPAGDYSVQVRLYYDDAGLPQDTAETALTIPDVEAG
jgi:hypothetical protein